MLEGIKDDVVALLNDDLMEYIVEDARELIHAFESKILSKEHKVFSQFEKLMERVQNVVELSFRYIGNHEKTIPCAVAWLIMDLTELKSAIRQCNYSFEEREIPLMCKKS